MRRTTISGVVFFDRTRAISAERRSGVRRSTMTGSLCRYTLRYLDCGENVGQDRLGDDRTHAVADHSEAMPDGRMKTEIVREPLQQRRLAHGDDPVLVGMNRPNRQVG